MTVKYQYYDSGDDNDIECWDVNYWIAQTFTPSTSHKITKVKLLLYRVGDPGTLTVAIRATSSGKPTGSDLCSGTTDGDTLPIGSPYAWREIEFSSSYNLVASTQYAIVVRGASGVDVNNCVSWRVDSTSATYTGGNSLISTDGGSNWSISGMSGWDMLFEEWGEPATPQVSTEECTSISLSTATGNGSIIDLGSSAVTQHGHCWATSVDPTTSDSKTSNGAGSLGAFTSSITGLQEGTVYYVRAYATNSTGTSYGNNVFFTAGESHSHMEPGNIAVKTTTLRYIGEDGIEYYIQGTAA